MGLALNILGKKFGRLLVMAETNKRTEYGSIIWQCLCECGKTSYHVGYQLKNGSIRSCGCLRKSKDPQTSGLYVMFSDYRYGAKYRGYKFNLTFKQFRNIVEDDCIYCGIEPQKRERKHKFKANGIDRVDNSLGYKLSNVVSCCSDCNKAKNTMVYENFIKWIERIRNYEKK